MLTTPRLRLRRFHLYDLAFLDRLHSDPQVVRFLGHGDVRSRAENAKWLENAVKSNSNGVAQYLITLTHTGEPIGRVGLSAGQVEWAGMLPRVCFEAERQAGSVPFVELGYVLLRAHWGKGYATEAAVAVRDHAYESGAIDQLQSLIHPSNSGSFSVARKLGFSPQKQVVYRGLRCVLVGGERKQMAA